MSTAFQVRIDSLLHALASSLCAEFDAAAEESGVAKPCLCTVLPGSVLSFDYCDEGGMAWARLVGIEPVERQEGRVCVIEYDVTIEVGALRCAPSLGENGELPSEAEQLAASMMQNYDLGILHKVLTCTKVPESFDFAAMGPYTPIGPDGNCLGGTWTRTWRTA